MKEYQSLFDLTGRRALVVGAASGIGEAAAHGLAAFGAQVTCADLRFNEAGRVAAAIEADGGRADAITSTSGTLPLWRRRATSTVPPTCSS